MVDGLVRILKASKIRNEKAKKGLLKLLSKDTWVAKKILLDAESKLSKLKEKEKNEKI